jgi:hypothetical protein
MSLFVIFVLAAAAWMIHEDKAEHARDLKAKH